MEDHFPHKSLMINHQTLPMSLVWTFICLATRFGFEARPARHPRTAIKLPESKEWLYVDLFREKLTTQTEAEVSGSLPLGSLCEFFQPAMTRSAVTRAVKYVFVSAVKELRVHWHALYLVIVFFASLGVRENTTNTLGGFILLTANDHGPLDLIPI